MKKIYNKAIGLVALLGIIVSILVLASTREMSIAVLTDTDSYQLVSVEFDWNLPTAVSVGLKHYQLELLSDDEIRFLHQPYIDIVDAISLEFDVCITSGTLECYFLTREDILYVIFNVSLAEQEYHFRKLAEQMRDAIYTAMLAESLVDAGYAEVLLELMIAFDNNVINPTYAYYLFQQAADVNSLIDKINVTR